MIKTVILCYRWKELRLFQENNLLIRENQENDSLPFKNQFECHVFGMQKDQQDLKT